MTLAAGYLGVGTSVAEVPHAALPATGASRRTAMHEVRDEPWWPVPIALCPPGVAGGRQGRLARMRMPAAVKIVVVASSKSGMFVFEIVVNWPPPPPFQ